MVLLRFGKRGTKKKVCLDDELKEEDSHELLELPESDAIQKRSPIADAFMSHSLTESTTVELGTSLLDDILKELHPEPAVKVSESVIQCHDLTCEDDAGQDHSLIPASDARQQTSNGNASLSSSLQQPQQTTLTSNPKTSSTISSFTPIKAQLQQIQQQQQQKSSHQTPKPSSAPIVPDSDDSDESSSDEAPSPPITTGRKPSPQKKHARIIAADSPKQLMDRMKERHRQECRRSITPQPFILGNQSRFQATASPSMPSLRLAEAPVTVPIQNLASSKSYNAFPTYQSGLVRSSSATSDFYRQHQMSGANQHHPPSMVHMQPTNRLHAFPLHQQHQQHSQQQHPLARPISIVSDGGGVHPLSASKSAYASLHQPTRAQSPPLVTVGPPMSHLPKATAVKAHASPKQIASTEPSEPVPVNDSAHGPLPSMHGSAISEPLPTAAQWQETKAQPVTVLSEPKSLEMAPTAGLDDEEPEHSMRGSSRSSSTSASSDSTNSSKALVTDDEHSVAPIPVMDPHYFLPAKLKHQLHEMRSLKQSISVPDLKDLSQQQQHVQLQHQQPVFKPVGMFGYHADQAREKMIAPMQPYPLYEDPYGASMMNYPAFPPWPSHMYPSPSMLMMMHSQHAQHHLHHHPTQQSSDDPTLNHTCHGSGSAHHHHPHHSNASAPCCSPANHGHPLPGCHQSHQHHHANHVGCQHHGAPAKHCSAYSSSPAAHKKDDKKSSGCCKKHGHRHAHHGHHRHQHQHHTRHQTGCAHQHGHTRAGYSACTEDFDSKSEQVPTS